MEEIEILRRKYYEEGKTISEVHSDTGIDRKTVRRRKGVGSIYFPTPGCV